MTIFFLCLKIYFARICDVTLGTIRTNYSVRGKTIISGCIAFIEVFIWFLIVKEALNTNENGIIIGISYALGYATGTIIGTYISKKFINTLITAEIITFKATNEMIDSIKKEGFGISLIPTSNNKSNLLLITLNSKNLAQLKKIVYHFDKQAFMVVNESKVVQNGFIK